MRPDRPPLPGPLGRPLGRLAAAFYAREIARRNRAFDRGEGVTRLDRPVVSVGNLSAGGTGKTPMVMRLVQSLIEAGHRPCIAMRGYRAGNARSDEAEEYAARLAGVPVVAQPDRTAGLRALFERDEGRGVDAVVLDDGFQHRRIARDADVVLLDASRSPLTDRLLPAGYLREPLESLVRADAVVITHAEAAPEGEVARLERAVGEVNPDLVVAVARHSWAGLEGPEGALPVGWLDGRRVLAVCAIGNPGAFLRAAEAGGADVAERIVLRDHDAYAPATVERIVRLARETGAGAILTTGKDWSKLSGVEGWPCPVVRPRLEMAFDRGWEALRELVLERVGRSCSVRG